MAGKYNLEEKQMARKIHDNNGAIRELQKRIDQYHRMNGDKSKNPYLTK